MQMQLSSIVTLPLIHHQRQSHDENELGELGVHVPLFPENSYDKIVEIFFSKISVKFFSLQKRFQNFFTTGS